MQKKLCLVIASFLLAIPTAAYAEFTPIAGWDKQLFPSYLIGTAAMKTDGVELGPYELGDVNGMLGVQIVAPHSEAKIEVTIECSEFTEPSTFHGVLESEGETYTIMPKMKYRFDRLSTCYQATPTSVTFRVAIDGSEVEEISTTITMRSINDCPLGYQSGEAFVDTSFAFACYVNEQHPFIDKLLREALDRGVVDSFIGYQGGTDESVMAQVYSVWDVLVARDVRYSSITQTAADSDIVFGQNVRLLEDTVNNQQANCVDGSVLLVSILRKIGIEAQLVLVPGHCYVRFFLDDKRTKAVALETTLMGSEVTEDQIADGFMDDVIDESLIDENSWPSFALAVQDGMQKFLDAKEKFDDIEDRDHQIVDIGAARKLGVLPIPHRNTELFVSFDHSDTADQLTDESDEGSEWSDDESEDDNE